MELLYQFYKRCASVNAHLRQNLQGSAHAGAFLPSVKKRAVKLNPNRSRMKNKAFSEYGALPHRPTKGLSVFVCLFLPLAATTENLFGNLRAKTCFFLKYRFC
jgi:hypothetical protein